MKGPVRARHLLIALVLASCLLGGAAAASAAPITLTQFTTTNSDLDPITGGDPGNTPFQKALAKATGVNIRWIVATPEDSTQKLQLLIASRDVPDIFADGQFSLTYPGGASKAAEDGVIAKINPYLDTLARDFKAVFTAKPEYEKNLRADNGDVYGFACFRGGKLSTVFFGPMIRKDILDKAGVAIPETIDEWHTALVALKNNGFKTAFSMLDWYAGYSGAFVGAYGGCVNYYAGKDAKMHYGAVEEGYRQYLALMNKWYTEGLLDPDASTMKDMGVLDTKMISGKVGATINWISRVKRYNVEGSKTDPAYSMVATRYPVLKKGDQPLYAQADPPVVMSFFVGATSKRVQDTMKWYDYGYTKAGQMLYNFGILGESYTLDASGNATYTDEIFHNSKGWSETAAKQLYAPIVGDAPALEDLRFFSQLMLNIPAQQAAAKAWGDAQYSSILPNLSYTAAENVVMKKQGDIDTYVQEQTAKFILGEMSLTRWNEYVQRIKDMGVDSVLAAYNAAYARYLKR
jgi:putative aldouronate transport system substrate-binding protein